MGPGKDQCKDRGQGISPAEQAEEAAEGQRVVQGFRGIDHVAEIEAPPAAERVEDEDFLDGVLGDQRVGDAAEHHQARHPEEDQESEPTRPVIEPDDLGIQCQRHPAQTQPATSSKSKKTMLGASPVRCMNVARPSVIGWT